MNKTNIIFRLVTCFLIQAFVFTNACFALGDIFKNNTEKNFLAPALQLKNDGVFQLYSILQHYWDNNHSGIKGYKANGDYKKLLKRLIEQVGTADELLEKIKNKYKNEFGEVIRFLEAKEEHYKIHNEDWVIEHQKEVMLMAYCMGKIMGFDSYHLARIAFASRFHDIGKLKINKDVINGNHSFSDQILLTSEQRDIMRREIEKHAGQSHEIFKEAGITDKLILSIVLHHHANVDGSGYPFPITRQEIPFEAKMVRVADSFSAMLGNRPYSRPFEQSFTSAVRNIEEGTYYSYGPRAVKIFLSMLGDEEIKDRHNEVYSIAVREDEIFKDLLKEAKKLKFSYPFAKVACGISRKWNERPYCTVTNSIGIGRHAEVNLILKVLRNRLIAQGQKTISIERLIRLEFLAYTSKLNESQEALTLLKTIAEETGNPFKGAVIYVTLQPCSSCIDLLTSLGVKQIYYASEHHDPEFVAESKKKADKLREKGVKIVQAHFLNEGAFEPNSLFFTFCKQPGYEKIARTINDWFAAFLIRNNEAKFSLSVMREKERKFTEMINTLIGDLDMQTDLEQINNRLVSVKDMIGGNNTIDSSKVDFFKNHYLIRQSI